MSLTKCCKLKEAEYMEIFQHVSARRLSLELCVTLILRLYDLASYFKSASMVPTVFPGDHTNIHFIQPPAPDRAVVNIFIAWWGTLGGWHMRLLRCAFSFWCFFFFFAGSLYNNCHPLNDCVVDDKLHSQAVCKVHDSYSAAGPQTAPWNCF